MTQVQVTRANDVFSPISFGGLCETEDERKAVYALFMGMCAPGKIKEILLSHDVDYARSLPDSMLNTLSALCNQIASQFR